MMMMMMMFIGDEEGSQIRKGRDGEEQNLTNHKNKKAKRAKKELHTGRGILTARLRRSGLVAWAHDGCYNSKPLSGPYIRPLKYAKNMHFILCPRRKVPNRKMLLFQSLESP